MNAPVLEENKCSVLITESATGHVLKRDLTLFLDGDFESEAWQLFDSFSDAERFVLNFIKSKPEFECAIYNHKGEYLKTYDLTGERTFN